MAEMNPQPPVSKAALWTGRIISVLPVLGLVMSGAMKFTKSEELIKGFEHLGWPVDYALGLGILELSCVAIYAFPPTAVLGAILVTGYMGGAIATHVRIGELNVVPHVLIGVLAWLGLYLRDPRVRSLIPFRRPR